MSASEKRIYAPYKWHDGQVTETGARPATAVPDTVMKKECDIVICGGGLVGSTLAGLLADSGLRVVILESGPPQAVNDTRVSALSLATKNILASLGVWKALLSEKVPPTPVMDMKIWDASSYGKIHFDSAEIGEPCLGYIAENHTVLMALHSHIQNCANIEFAYHSPLTDINFSQEDATVHYGNGNTITTKLVIGADGSRSRVRSIVGIANRAWQYMQTAIVATVESEHCHKNTAWQRFLPTGPLAFLPLQDQHKTSIVWSADTEYAEELLALSDQEFIRVLGEQFEHRLGIVKKISERAAFPLSYGHSENYVDERIALVGDAAHRAHPLAGQGLNMGMLDAAVLAEVITKNSESNKDIGKLRNLRTYTRWRQFDNRIMLMALDGFKRFYGSDRPVLNNIRGVGMNMVSSLPMLRRNLMYFASGAGGNLPRSARSSISSQ